MAGEVRSCFAMTEPAVASSDATNIESRIHAHPQGGYVLEGRKWWTSGACDPRCKVAIFMGKTDPSAPAHRQQSMILVPMDTPGVTVVRPVTVFGYDDAPHGHAEVHFEGVRVPAEAVLLGEGRGFEIAQGRLGPGRLHHCMRAVGMAERAMEMTRERMATRKAFGSVLAGHGALLQQLAEMRIQVEGARLAVLNAAHQLDLHGNKVARPAIAIAKVVAPRAAQAVLDAAIQVHGGGGVSGDYVLAAFFAGARVLRLADGPDEVHLRDIGRMEMKGKARL
uniref:Acyl-CoA dehydrogenase/oxidase C-terminal domain-containing protein n=1 Tax=Pyramimonas obovata TaxID=1411642 RepID=A0A7S0WSV9_9CHLO